MKIEIVEKAKETKALEIVPGGVYRLYPNSDNTGAFYRLLVYYNGQYATFDLETGRIGFVFQDREDIEKALRLHRAEYIPNAKLVVEVDS